MILKRTISIFLFAMALSLLAVSCAKKGTPQGGDIDSIPPVFVRSIPENYNTRFKSEEITIHFDEYIKLDDPQRQIIISPPIDPKPEIYPMGSASKYARIRFLSDTLLKDNTTYTINFGKSITDNNEGNPLSFFKYVFSTGDYVDSLNVSGRVRDALLRETDEFVSIMLYEVDSTYTDSIIYQKPPTYIAYTQDSTNTFTIENMKKGTYKMVAMKDNNDNYLFEPKNDKVGFIAKNISIPTEENFDIKIFIEQLDFEAKRPKQLAKHHLIFGYEGKPDSTKIKLLSEKPDNLDYRIIKDKETDTLHYWYKPYFEADSLLFEVKNSSYQDTLMTKIREMEEDSLQISALSKNAIDIDEEYKLTANIPLVAIDTSQISIINKDSLEVTFNTQFERFENSYIIDFEKEEQENYIIKLLPGALTDFYDNTNDTLQFKARTPKLSEMGTLALTVTNLQQYPVIVQLTNEKGEVKKELYHTKEDGNIFNFEYLSPATYYIRVIYDENKNRVWNTGNYLEKKQPEEIIHFPKGLEIRANWDVSQTFSLNQ